MKTSALNASNMFRDNNLFPGNGGFCAAVKKYLLLIRIKTGCVNSYGYPPG